MKVKVEAVSVKHKSFKANGKWYEYDNISEVQRGKWYDIEVAKDGKTVVSLKPSVYNSNNTQSNVKTVGSNVYLLSNEQFESIKKYLEKSLYLKIKSSAFEIAKTVVDKYYQDKTEAEYIAALEEYIDYFSKLMIVGEDNDTSEGDKKED